MQSFIVNVPDDKEAFFLELVNQLGFEVLDIDEQPLNDNAIEEETNGDSFLDWEEERRNIKRARKEK